MDHWLLTCRICRITFPDARIRSLAAVIPLPDGRIISKSYFWMTCKDHIAGSQIRLHFRIMDHSSGLNLWISFPDRISGSCFRIREFRITFPDRTALKKCGYLLRPVFAWNKIKNLKNRTYNDGMHQNCTYIGKSANYPQIFSVYSLGAYHLISFLENSYVEAYILFLKYYLWYK